MTGEAAIELRSTIVFAEENRRFRDSFHINWANMDKQLIELTSMSVDWSENSDFAGTEGVRLVR